MSIPQSLQEYGKSIYDNAPSPGTAFLDNFSLEDKSFDISKSESYHLSIQLSNTGITYSVLDIERNKYLTIENIGLNNPFGSTFPEEEARSAFADRAILKSKYKSVSAAYINNQATLVPTAIFDQGKAREYLRLNLEESKVTIDSARANGSHLEFAMDTLNELKSVNLYYFPEEVKNTLRSAHKNVVIKHHSSILIQSALLRYKNQHKKILLVHFHKDSFEILVINENQLKLYNSFFYQSVEDFVYYILFACEQLSLNPEQIETVVFGQLNKHSDYYSMLYTYIRNITISKRPDNFEYSYQFEDLPAHYYYNLFSQYLCV